MCKLKTEISQTILTWNKTRLICRLTCWLGSDRSPECALYAPPSANRFQLVCPCGQWAVRTALQMTRRHVFLLGRASSCPSDAWPEFWCTKHGHTKWHKCFTPAVAVRAEDKKSTVFAGGACKSALESLPKLAIIPKFTFNATVFKSKTCTSKWYQGQHVTAIITVEMAICEL